MIDANIQHTHTHLERLIGPMERVCPLFESRGCCSSDQRTECPQPTHSGPSTLYRSRFSQERPGFLVPCSFGSWWVGINMHNDFQGAGGSNNGIFSWSRCLVCISILSLVISEHLYEDAWTVDRNIRSILYMVPCLILVQKMVWFPLVYKCLVVSRFRFGWYLQRKDINHQYPNILPEVKCTYNVCTHIFIHARVYSWIEIVTYVLGMLWLKMLMYTSSQCIYEFQYLDAAATFCIRKPHRAYSFTWCRSHFL